MENGPQSSLNQNKQVPLENTTSVSCDKCNNTFFKPVMILRKVSRLITGQPNDTIAPIQVFACDSCGHVNEVFIPAPFREKASEKEVEFTDDKKDKKGPKKTK